jgi:hypothetical protein
MVFDKPAGFGSHVAFCLWGGSNDGCPGCDTGASINYSSCRNPGTRHSGCHRSADGDYGSNCRRPELRDGSGCAERLLRDRFRSAL